MGGCVVLVILGGVFEIAGFVFVAWEIARIQRDEFGTPQFVTRLRGWVRRLLRRPPTTHTAEMVGHAGGTSSATGRLTVGVPPHATPEQRITALERNVGELRRELDDRAAALESSIRKVEQAQHEMRSELDAQQRKREDRRRAALQRTVKLQTFGTALFVVGAVLSVLGNTVSC